MVLFDSISQKIIRNIKQVGLTSPQALFFASAFFQRHANFQFETPHNSNAEHLGNSESKLPTGGLGHIFHIFSFAINGIMYIYMNIGGQETKLLEDTLIMKRNNPQKDLAALSLLLVIGPVATFRFPTGKTKIPTWKSFLFLEAGEIFKLLQRKQAN
ncbi:hypothetical protein O181_084382 [Austropuccinia psidii MF-1]|uniref:Uncharacterized protein n=1 Tax=Austropuccinia psidii MF-1 TaxID=1389203 RepID=A0A9Q3FW66_9BASI|nr:hypothetical protein [Austropuccinia psidii MF-1]